MQIGRRIREIRKAAGIGIKTMAKLVGVDVSYLSRIESGRVSPSEQVLGKLSKALKCDEQELMLLTNRVPRNWRSAITKSPSETALILHDSLSSANNDFLIADGTQNNGLTVGLGQINQEALYQGDVAMPSLSTDTTLFHKTEDLKPGVVPSCALVRGGSEDVLKHWRKVIKEPFQCVVTSPPYWGLRDYQNGSKGHQLGSEDTPDQYIRRLVDIFEHVKTVLADDGVFWLNVGDSYTSGNRGWRAPDGKNKHRAMSFRPNNPPGLKDKELVGLPWRIAAGLQNAGWYLRSEIIWNKPNCQPESVKDRPTRSHEMLFMFTKKERYFYDYAYSMSSGRNLRTVWDINTQPVLGDHPATYPIALATRCIRLTTKPGQYVLDPFIGSGSTCLAAAGLSRKSLGIDIKSEYLSVALRRITSLKPVLMPVHS